MAATSAQGAREKIGTVAEMFGGALDASFGGVRNVASQRRVVQNDGNGGRRKSAALGYVANCDRGRQRAFARKFRRTPGFRRCGLSRRLRIRGFHALLEVQPLAGGHYRTMKRVSSFPLILLLPIISLLLSLSSLVSAQSTAQHSGQDPQKFFEAGEAALRAGKLDEAERAFKQVLVLNLEVAGAYANLGVIHMRRKQWPQALEMLGKAEKLAPEIAGIRLNIRLVYFRQNDFARAIHPFESVVQQTPDSFQARYLLGLCYFFNDRWTDAIGTLEPLWGRASDQLNYLYVLEHAADKAKNPALEEKAAARLVEIGEGSPEFHLLMGKAHINRGEYDDG